MQRERMRYIERGQRGKKREREAERERDRERDRQTDRQTEKERQTDRQTDRQRGYSIEITGKVYMIETVLSSHTTRHGNGM